MSLFQQEFSPGSGTTTPPHVEEPKLGAAAAARVVEVLLSMEAQQGNGPGTNRIQGT